MDRLKAILADKVLDLSTNNSEEVKIKIDKIQRFRDFTNACKTLMTKYPAIEEELIKMAADGDFDTKVASSRVDTIIRLADTEATQFNKTPKQTEDNFSHSAIKPQIEETPTPVEIEKPDSVVIPNIYDSPMSLEYPPQEELQQAFLPEDIDYEEIETSIDEEHDSEYVKFEEIRKEENSTVSIPQIEEEELSAIKRKKNIRRVIQLIGLALAIVAVIFIVRFVMNNWQTILIIAGILILLAILYVWVKRKRN